MMGEGRREMGDGIVKYGAVALTFVCWTPSGDGRWETGRSNMLLSHHIVSDTGVAHPRRGSGDGTLRAQI